MVALLALLVGGGMLLFDLQRDLDSVQQRAQLAANPTDMLAYMRTLADNLARHEAVAGHTALVLKTPANDLALHYRTVNSVIARLEPIQALPPDSDAYQSGLDDLRGIVREMPKIASGVFWAKYGWWMGLLAVVCVGVILPD
jgi:hypothetical protein